MKKSNKLTTAQLAALASNNNGAVFAGNTVSKGSVVRVNASTVMALARRGLVALAISPDGGMVGHLTDAGRAVLAEVSR